MKTQDRLIMVVSAALVILFIVSVAENIRKPGSNSGAGINTAASEIQTENIMETLKKSGLTPREARYYE